MGPGRWAAFSIEGPGFVNGGAGAGTPMLGRPTDSGAVPPSIRSAALPKASCLARRTEGSNLAGAVLS